MSTNALKSTFQITCRNVRFKFTKLRPSLMGSELRCQNFDLVKFREIIPRNPVMGPFFLRTLNQNSRKILIRRLSPNLSENFGQILTRALGLITWSELHLEVVAPRFEEIYKGGREGHSRPQPFVIAAVALPSLVTEESTRRTGLYQGYH